MAFTGRPDDPPTLRTVQRSLAVIGQKKASYIARVIADRRGGDSGLFASLRGPAQSLSGGFIKVVPVPTGIAGVNQGAQITIVCCRFVMYNQQPLAGGSCFGRDAGL
jgi:hypothetical protein